MQELAWSSWMWELDPGMQVYLDWFKVLLFLSSFLVFCFWVLREQKISESWESQNWIEIWNGKKKYWKRMDMGKRFLQTFWVCCLFISWSGRCKCTVEICTLLSKNKLFTVGCFPEQVLLHSCFPHEVFLHTCLSPEKVLHSFAELNLRICGESLDCFSNPQQFDEEQIL